MTTSPLELDYVMSLAWPEGVSRYEKALAYTLDDHRREIAVRRITALLAYEDGDARWRDASAKAGLDRSSFFVILSAWRRDRSLRAVTPRTTEHRGMVRPRPDMERIIRDVMRESPSLNRREIATATRERLPEPAGLSTIDRMIDRIRTHDESVGLGGRDGFGRRLVIDSSMMLMDKGRDDRSLASVVTLVVDVATRVVIAAAACDDAAASTRAACRRASARLGSMRDVPWNGAAIEMHVPSVPPGMTMGPQDVNGIQVTIARKTGRRDAASRLSALLDHDFGVMKIRPRLVTEDDGRPEGRMPILAAMDAIADGQAERCFAETVGNGLVPATSPHHIAETIDMLVGNGGKG